MTSMHPLLQKFSLMILNPIGKKNLARKPVGEIPGLKPKRIIIYTLDFEITVRLCIAKNIQKLIEVGPFSLVFNTGHFINFKVPSKTTQNSRF